jgi:hypothetical protein
MKAFLRGCVAGLGIAGAACGIAFGLALAKQHLGHGAVLALVLVAVVIGGGILNWWSER